MVSEWCGNYATSFTHPHMQDIVIIKLGDFHTPTNGLQLTFLHAIFSSAKRSRYEENYQ